ncbi:manganese/iron transport system ATP-binding protein [Thermostichus sp. MS-CIW-19]|jgi:manganese/iron transport system ATP-binding protein|uniref:metal ABC transporter ATP-binding protein n=1 Tax=unclassified Synechococcus TaxID=2626047 RepID=UPI00006944E3|nr:MULTISPECIES: metal ABC transporter ATP-binding protein [unclassified Synechococcus]ABC99835.1 manganese/zinc/iron chelate ABC transporter (MZT) family, ATP-binding protein [Synechococcus sp. JA-3-3Ab]PIK87232.1 manganese ABC transporter ATP-binding protein [Synechococcus sp. 63AY4M2]PIK88154.1 manganese ABC transporter ATP-binding protein [Synechococcus sp. 65AY6A5]PIK92592.1 manganese ABC transporter ATP-binding protein [Synechococcus sp. 65AY6Li]PIK98528.1 manganese ABC transporter ATP-b
MKKPAVSLPLRPASLVVRDLTVRYGKLLALERIGAEIRPGRITGILGPNGAGKSTLLKALLGLVPKEGGEVRYGGQVLRGEQVAYVPQRSAIDWSFPATVWDVVLMGQVRAAGWLRRIGPEGRERAAQALERVGMGAYRDRPIGRLSGGQQQRVFLARALAQEAEIYALDEPLAGIDQPSEAIVFQVLRELADAGHIVMVVHHDLGQALAYFDEVLLLNRVLIAQGSPQQVLQPQVLQRAYGRILPLDSAA